MAGHSKWANIKHRKAKEDAKKGKVFTRLIREVTVAARMGGAELGSNPRLRDAVSKARASNMSGDTIERAISRGAGGLDGANVDDVLYEGYGPSGVAILVECMTDNKNRTVSEVRHAFSKRGGNLGTDGSVAYLFTKRGIISYAPGADEEKILECALEAGAEDVITNDDQSIDVITAPELFTSIKESLIAAGLKTEHADVVMDASVKVALDQASAEKVLALLDMLEELDDVQNVYSNLELPDDFVESE